MEKFKWFEKDGHIFSEEVKKKTNNDFRFSRVWDSNTVIALNVGKKVAKHIVALHNASLK